jgi:predicted RNA-binding Zn-ribbon protein involved in translation (DUF1610 family)
MSSSPPEQAALVPLACPACGGALDPLREDVLFLCPSCGAASELTGATNVRRELHHATPAAERAALHLPFWRLGASAVTPAFNGSRLLTLTRWYSERTSALDAHLGGLAPRGLWGGRIGARDAPRLLALATGESAPGPPVLLAVPFQHEPSRLVCAITGLHLYLETLEGSRELMARWEKLRS